MTDIFTHIANKHLHIETLETRNSDLLDFHEVSAASVKTALRRAFEAGARESAKAIEIMSDTPTAASVTNSLLCCDASEKLTDVQALAGELVFDTLVQNERTLNLAQNL